MEKFNAFQGPSRNYDYSGKILVFFDEILDVSQVKLQIFLKF